MLCSTVRTFAPRTPRLVSVMYRATEQTLQKERVYTSPLTKSVSAYGNPGLQQSRSYTQSKTTGMSAQNPAPVSEEGARGGQETNNPLGLQFPEWMKSTKVMPRLTEEDRAERLRPLTEKYSWQKMSRSTEDDHLYRRYVFKGPRSARRFVAFLMQIEEEYDHHTAFSLSSEKRPVVQVLTQTHAMEGGPGISLKDIHLAALTEQHYRTGNYEPKTVDPVHHDVWNLYV